MEIVAAVAHRKGEPFALERVSLEEPRDDEVLVRIEAVGLCHTDLAFRDDVDFLSFPAVLGHEGAGVVERVGKAVSSVAPGDHVVASFASCGVCKMCIAQRPSCCAAFAPLNYLGKRTDGSTALRAGGKAISSHFFGQSSFASHALVGERNLVRVGSDLPLEILAPLGCGVQTGAGAVMRAMTCPRGTSLLVLGGGAVGLSAVLGAVLKGMYPIVVAEPVAGRRALARELGATHTIDPANDIATSLRTIAPDGVDFALDTTGRSDVLEAAMRCLSSSGTLGVVAAQSMEMGPPGNLGAMITAGQTIKGIIEGDSLPQIFIPELIEHYRAGRFPFDKMIATFPLSQINAAVTAHRAGEIVKAVLVTGKKN
jgi:aryl-alcohol dehydrogenase